MTIIFIRNVVRQGDNGQTKPIFVLDLCVCFVGIFCTHTIHYIYSILYCVGSGMFFLMPEGFCLSMVYKHLFQKEKSSIQKKEGFLVKSLLFLRVF